jgi:hypothetical protein
MILPTYPNSWSGYVLEKELEGKVYVLAVKQNMTVCDATRKAIEKYVNAAALDLPILKTDRPSLTIMIQQYLSMLRMS